MSIPAVYIIGIGNTEDGAIYSAILTTLNALVMHDKAVFGTHQQ
jgi:hypothetical protein